MQRNLNIGQKTAQFDNYIVIYLCICFTAHIYFYEGIWSILEWEPSNQNIVQKQLDMNCCFQERKQPVLKWTKEFLN